MKKLSPNDSLNQAIALLEKKREEEIVDMKAQFHTLYESLKPINLIKDIFKAAIASPNLKNGIGKTMIGFVSGFLVKNIFFRKSHNPLKIVAGALLPMMASSVASNHSDQIRLTGQKLFHSLLSLIKHNRQGVHVGEIKTS